jgi:2'-5' RNA ligase superfamily
VRRDPSFILTLKLDEDSFGLLQSWRTRYFPPERNYLPAHLTLFHTLSAQQIENLQAHWPALAGAPIELRYVAPRLLGGGVAINVESPGLVAMRTRLMTAMSGAYTRQDQQPFRAHVTIQNKVPPAQARELFEHYQTQFKPWSGRAQAVLVWEYLGGPWALQSEHPFH